MKQYKLWDKTSAINNVPATHFLNQNPFKGYAGDVILIYAENGVTVTNVECKDILAEVFDIDKTLPIDEFMAVYFAKQEEISKAVAEQAVRENG